MDDSVTARIAAREVLRRQRAEASFVEFSQAVELPGVPASNLEECEDFKPIETRVALHHIVMMQAMERTMLKPRGRLMIFMPPGCAKSTYAVAASAWFMGKFPNSSIIYTSYATGIAAKQSRRVRAICRDPNYQSIWSDRPKLLEDQRAVDDWSMTNGSTFLAAGILAGITGNRADGIVIDDPVANREQADSPTVRAKTYEEYIDTVLTRAKPTMWTIIIQTRWHEDDLAGAILPEKYNGESGLIKCRDGQTWEVLCIPAEAERADDVLGRKPGDFIWPEWYPKEHWASWRDNPRARRTWSALYQQRPAPQTGIQFSREVLEANRYDPDKAAGDDGARPVHLRMYGASDYATLANDGDFTVHLVAGMDPDGDLWVVDCWRQQKETDVSIDAFIAKVGVWKPARWANEGGLLDKAIGPAIRRRMRETQKYVVIESLTSIADKSIKLQSFHARANAGAVHFPLRRPWADQVIDELVAFPGGRHDDAADCCGLIGRMLDKMTEAHIPVMESKPLLVPFTERWLEWKGDSKPKVRYTS